LAWYESASQDSDEKAQRDEAGYVVHQAGHCGWNGSC
jgi:hypothetical protein